MNDIYIHHLQNRMEELWRETFAEALLEWEPPELKRVLETGIGLQIISQEAANEIAAALGVG